MKIYIDGKVIATEKASGRIKNLPYPINIGRNAEIHNCETNVAICDALIDNVGIFSKSLSPDKMGKDQASLWLDFEDEVDEGNFYSYGIGARTYGSIWPDRTPQPEMWQMKKTCQPLDFSMVDEKNFIIEIWNHLGFTSSDYYNLEWLLKEDDSIIQRGKVVCAVQPLQKQQTKLPINIPTLKSGAEYRIELSEKEYFIDLLFYNRILQCLVAFELKRGNFKPEFAGKLNFYLNILDYTVKLPNENPSIGIILCKQKDNAIVEYSFKNINKAMGVATYETSEKVPEQWKEVLPSPEDLRKLL